MEQHERVTMSRGRRVRRVLLIEGLANLSIAIVKATVGVTTGSTAVLGDAVHSFADLGNNAVAWAAARLAAQPADREHPYGHHKFETLAVFGLATLLAVLAVELALHSLRRGDDPVVGGSGAVALMLGVLGVNVALSTWEARRARQLDSLLLRADARHTFADVLTTLAVIAGWQGAAAGYRWLDTAATLAVSALILGLAWGLFRRAIPVLVDRIAADPDELSAAVSAVPGVHAIRRVRSHGSGSGARVDVVVSVEARLSTVDSHAIADAVERAVRQRFGAEDVSVHVEPDSIEREVAEAAPESSDRS